MPKSRSYSIFLLKSGYDDPETALTSDHPLEKATLTGTAEHDWPIYLSRKPTASPWWRDHFSIGEVLTQGLSGAIVFVKAAERTFALTFGHTRSYLDDESYEYDFGLRTTLNAVDPVEIRNTDEVDPATSRRRRTQLSERADLTYFDFDSDNSILRSLTGAIRPEYKELFSHATGSSSLRVSTAVDPTKLVALLNRIMALYREDTYLTAFPAASNIQPVQDPVVLSQLNNDLVRAFCAKKQDISLSIPELLDFQEDFEISFSGSGKSPSHDVATLNDFYQYLETNGTEFSNFSSEDLRRHRLIITTDAHVRKGNYSILRCLVYETSLPGDAAAYHLSEGRWYRVDADFLSTLATYLDPFFCESKLPPRTEPSEFAYNENQLVKHWNGSVLLDRTNTSPAGQKQVEPCDVARNEQDHLILSHVKLGVAAADLSHLFSQGTTSIDLLNGVLEARVKLEDLISERNPNFDLKPISNQRFKVEYVIVTNNAGSLKSGALPLFSRISLRRACRSLTSMKTDVSVHLVPDSYKGKKSAKSRKNKKGSG